MEKIPVDFVYWTHGRMDTDIQDQVQNDIYPEFFREGEVNLLGVEDAGTYMDEARDFHLKRARQCPTMHTIVHPGEMGASKSDPFRIKKNFAFSARQSEAGGSFINRQRLLLAKWNEENPRRIAVPFMESYETDGERTRAERECEASTFIMQVRRKGLFWGELVSLVREFDEKFVKTPSARDSNWIRILAQIPDILKIGSGTKCRILVTLGSLHRNLTGMVADKLGHVFSVGDEHLLKGCDWGGNTLCQEKIAEGIAVSDEDLLRGLFYDAVLRSVIAAYASDPGAFYVFSAGFKSRLKEAVDRLGIGEICGMLGLSETQVDGSAGDSLLKVGFDESKRVNDYMEHGEEGADPQYERFVESLRPQDGIEDRSLMPNNLFLDKQYILFSLASELGIRDVNDGMVDLLWQALGTIQGEEPRSLIVMRRELYDQMSGCGGGCRMLESFVNMLARENPGQSRLYNDKSKNFKTSARLIQAIRFMLSR